jgi:DNA-binding transcriptional LysR family regulator
MRKLRIFKEVADTGSVSKAALQLHIAQPAVSLVIKELEQEYGCILFERLSRRLYITQKGRALLFDVNRVIEVYDAMEMNMRQSNITCEMRIGVGIASSHGHFIDTMKWIKQNHPAWDVRVNIHISPLIQQMLLNNEIDVGIIEGPSNHPHLISGILYSEDVVLLGSAKSISDPIRLDQLSQLPMILREADSMSRSLIDERMALAGIRLHVIWSSSSIEIIRRAVGENLGYTFLPIGIAREYIESGELKIIDIEGIELHRTVCWVMHRDKVMTPPIEAFLKKMEIGTSDEI